MGRTAELRFRPVLAELPADTRRRHAAGRRRRRRPRSPRATRVAIPNPQAIPNTAGADDKADACVVLPGRKQEQQAAVRYFLGPAALTGRETSGAKSEFQQGQGYGVNLSLKDSGREKFNQLAQQSFPKQPPQNRWRSCSTAWCSRHPGSTSRTSPATCRSPGTSRRARPSDLASVLKYGALPVRFDEKQQTVQSVSPTLGSDQLQVGHRGRHHRARRSSRSTCSSSTGCSAWS